MACPIPKHGALVCIAPPFRGHFHILYQTAAQWAREGCMSVYFVVCGWSNVPLPLQPNEFILPYTYLHDSALSSSDPNVFNAERCIAVEPILRQWLKDHVREPIQALVYDFFCWEAARLGDMLRIPTICSIPAVPPYWPTDAPEASKQRYLLRASTLSQQVGAFTEEEQKRVRMVSDGLYLPGSAGQWLWAPSALLHDCPAVAALGPNTAFVCPPVIAETPENPLVVPQEPVNTDVFVCFGTVVSGNLWDRYPEPVFAWMLCLVESIAKWTESSIGSGTVTIAIPYQHARFTAALKEYARVRVIGMCNQDIYLQTAQLFITHGGGNSLREAVDASCPMLVVPFFGDQWDTARHVVKSGAGLACFLWDQDDQMEPASTMAFAALPRDWDTNVHPSVTQRMHEKLQRAWNHRNAMRRVLQNASVTAIRASVALIEQSSSLIWKEGDLLFGTNADRHELERHQSAHVGPFHVGVLKPFSHLAAKTPTFRLPRLVDQYNDVLRHPPTLALERAHKDPSFADYCTRLTEFDAWVEQLGLFRPVTLHNSDACEQVSAMCTAGLDFFVRRYQAHIHFVLTSYDATINAATRRELFHIREHWAHFRNQVTFYKIENTSLVRVAPPWDIALTPLSSTPSILFSSSVLAIIMTRVRRDLEQALTDAPFAHRLQPAWNARIKSHQSCALNVTKGRCIDDMIGFRLSCPYTIQLYELAEYLRQYNGLKHLRITRSMVWEDGKIIYCRCGQNGGSLGEKNSKR